MIYPADLRTAERWELVEEARRHRALESAGLATAETRDRHEAITAELQDRYHARRGRRV